MAIRTNTLIRAHIRTQLRPNAVAMITHPLWSVSVMMAKGGDCPGGITTTMTGRVGIIRQQTTARQVIFGIPYGVRTLPVILRIEKEKKVKFSFHFV